MGIIGWDLTSKLNSQHHLILIFDLILIKWRDGTDTLRQFACLCHVMYLILHVKHAVELAENLSMWFGQIATNWSPVLSLRSIVATKIHSISDKLFQEPGLTILSHCNNCATKAHHLGSQRQNDHLHSEYSNGFKWGYFDIENRSQMFRLRRCSAHLRAVVTAGDK